MTAGLSPADAARRARLALGGVALIKEECRDGRGVTILEELVQDLRHGGVTTFNLLVPASIREAGGDAVRSHLAQVEARVKAMPASWPTSSME
jgi:hypothetical protein